MRFLNRVDTLEALPMSEAIEAMREAFGALDTGAAEIPARSHLRLDGLTALTMPGVLREPPRVGAKLITVVPDNAARGDAVIQGIVVLFDPDAGGVLGIIEGRTLTAIRTGAVSGLATQLLARDNAQSLAVIGSGPQADTQVEAVSCVRQIRRISIYSPTRTHAEQLANRLRSKSFARNLEVIVADSVANAVSDADVVCTATRATEPLLFSHDVREGVHINAVGSYTPEMREFDVDLAGRARIFVDDVGAAMEESGELIGAVDRGVVSRTQFTALGALVNRKVRGRTDSSEITLFKSVGLAVQDLCAGGRALDRAQKMNIGTWLDT